MIYLQGNGLFRFRFGLFLIVRSGLVGRRGRLRRGGSVARDRVLGRRLVGGLRLVDGGAVRRGSGRIGGRRRRLGRRRGFFVRRRRGLGQGGGADGRCAEQKQIARQRGGERGVRKSEDRWVG